MKVLVYTPELQCFEKELEEPLVEALQAEVGGYFEIVRVGQSIGMPGVIMVVDEEGLLKRSKINSVGMFLTNNTTRIVGNVLLCREAGSEMLGLTEFDVKLIRRKLGF